MTGCAADAAVEPASELRGVELRLTEIEPGTGRIEYALINHTEQPVRAVTWRTPADPAHDALFEVVQDGREVNYRGAHIYRLPSALQDRVEIGAGERLTFEVDLAKHYDVEKGGTFEVHSAIDVESLLPEASSVEFVAEPLHVKVDARASDGNVGVVTQAVTTTNCEFGQMLALESIIYAAREDVAAALNEYYSDPTGPRSVHWFGEQDATGIQNIAGRLQAIDQRLNNLNIDFFCGSPDYCPGPVAFVPNSTNDIYFCDVFWTLPGSGDLSLPHVLIHEVGHVVGMTDWGSSSVASYREHAEWWAANAPWIAQQNSENYALFITNP